MDGRLTILQLINEANNTLRRPLTLENVSLSLPVAKLETDVRNTGVQVAGIHGKGYKGQIEIFYNRHDLPKLFEDAGLTPNLRTNGEITPAWIIDQLNAKYGFYLEATDLNAINVPIFENLEETKPIEIVVKEQSWNWAGTITLEMTYGNPLLETVVIVQLLPVLTHPVNMTELGPRKSGYVSAYNFDFTAYKDQLKIDPKTARWANFDQVMAVGLKAGMPAWYNNSVVDMPTSAVPTANQAFERVMIQTYAGGGVMGPIYFHYDLNW
jgi:hypothetical protein